MQVLINFEQIISCVCCILINLRTSLTCLTYSGDEVVLQVEDLQISAPPVDMIDLLDVLLMQRNFLQREDLT